MYSLKELLEVLVTTLEEDISKHEGLVEITRSVVAYPHTLDVADQVVGAFNDPAVGFSAKYYTLSFKDGVVVASYHFRKKGDW